MKIESGGFSEGKDTDCSPRRSPYGMLNGLGVVCLLSYGLIPVLFFLGVGVFLTGEVLYGVLTFLFTGVHIFSLVMFLRYCRSVGQTHMVRLSRIDRVVSFLGFDIVYGEYRVSFRMGGDGDQEDVFFSYILGRRGDIAINYGEYTEVKVIFLMGGLWLTA